MVMQLSFIAVYLMGMATLGMYAQQRYHGPSEHAGFIHQGTIATFQEGIRLTR